VPLILLEVVDVGLLDVEFLTAQEEIVVTSRAGLVVELDVDVAGELPNRHDADVSLDFRVDDEHAILHGEAALVGLGFAVEGSTAGLLLPAGQVLAVEEQGEARLELKILGGHCGWPGGEKETEEEDAARSHGHDTPRDADAG